MNRLREILEQIKNEEEKDFYSFLSFEEEDLLNERGLEMTNYLMTGDDNIKETGYYPGIYPHWEVLDQSEIANLLDYHLVPFNLEVVASMIAHTEKNHFNAGGLFFQGETELEGADVLVTLFGEFIKDYEEAEEIAEEYKIATWYYHDYIQYNYLVNFKELEERIKEDETLFEEKETIIELIEKIEEKDEKAFQEFKRSILTDAA